MSSKKSKNITSVSMINIENFRTETLNNILLETTSQSELLIYYLDYIRNYKTFTNEMIENIKTMDNDNKMKIIEEYNYLMKSLVDTIIKN
jgi:hypothetical protein